MFQDFFYFVRAQKIPSSTSEYLDLLKTVEALQEQGQIISSERFYTLARNCLVKDIKYYDAFDIALLKLSAISLKLRVTFIKNLWTG